MSQFLDPRIRLEPVQLQREMRQQDKARLMAPSKRTMDPDVLRAMERVWVVYVWRDWACRWVTPKGHPDKQVVRQYKLGEKQWVLAGFVRRRNRRKPTTMGRRFAAIRRKLWLAKDEEVRIVTLFDDWQKIQEYGVSLYPEPSFNRREPEHIALSEPVMRAKQPARKVRKDSSPQFTKQTKYVVIGCSPFKQDAFVYLGALTSNTKQDALAEAERLFGGMYTVEAVPVTELEPKVVRRMRSRHIAVGDPWRFS